MSKLQSQWLTIVMVGMLLVGCGDPLGGAGAHMKAANKYNVAKLRTCCVTFASERGGKAPASKEDLVDFINEPYVSKSMERIGVNVNDLDAIFFSERDNEPLKVKWGSKVAAENPQPLVFEAVGVDGVRLVAGAVVMEVSDSARYDRLWEGSERIKEEDEEDQQE